MTLKSPKPKEWKDKESDMNGIKKVELKAGYYEWNLFYDDKLVYTPFQSGLVDEFNNVKSRKDFEITCQVIADSCYESIKEDWNDCMSLGEKKKEGVDYDFLHQVITTPALKKAVKTAIKKTLHNQFGYLIPKKKKDKGIER